MKDVKKVNKTVNEILIKLVFLIILPLLSLSCKYLKLLIKLILLKKNIYIIKT
jgi:hypothetical protein